MAGYSSNLGSALANIGANLPGAFRQRQLDARQQAIDEEESRKNAIVMRGTQNTIAAQEEDRDRQRAALDAIAKMNPNYRDPSGAPMTDEAAMNDEALQRERLIPENLPASSTIGFKKDEFDAVSNAVNALPRDKVMPSAADRFAAESDALAQYGDQEVVKQRLANLGKQMPSAASQRMSDQQQIAKLMDDYYATDDPDEKARIEETISVMQRYALSNMGQNRAVGLQNKLLPGKLQETAVSEQIKTGETMNRDKFKSELNVQEDLSKIENEKKLSAAMSTPDVGAAIDLIDNISTDEHLATGLNPRRLLASAPGTKEHYASQKVNNLLDKLVLIERGKLKGQGPITDKEQEMLRNSISILSTNLSKEDFDEELRKIRSVVDASKRRNEMVQERGYTGKSGPSGASSGATKSGKKFTILQD